MPERVSMKPDDPESRNLVAEIIAKEIRGHVALSDRYRAATLILEAVATHVTECQANAWEQGRVDGEWNVGEGVAAMFGDVDTGPPRTNPYKPEQEETP